MNDTFHDITEEFPVIKDLLHQLLLNVGKQKDHPTPRKQVPDHSAEEKNPLNVQNQTYCSVAAEATLLKQIDLNQENSFKIPVAHQRLCGKEN
ncbi:hypothetical protein QJS04_geneDACA000364 [Acorus gramineus]|uniref:Uncharacterized protein n=1 Tax=Acorus gramineus TaxID=55184 RepID=A0AAV9ATQ9_ACOGR|nr:hypothetical protein QJS04_geneDACA000364 [Acorus gramineus]